MRSLVLDVAVLRLGVQVERHPADHAADPRVLGVDPLSITARRTPAPVLPPNAHSRTCANGSAATSWMARSNAPDQAGSMLTGSGSPRSRGPGVARLAGLPRLDDAEQVAPQGLRG